MFAEDGVGATGSARGAPQTGRIKMVPEDLQYTKEHEWVKIEGKAAIVGITQYAVEQLGDITFVELSKVGKEVSQGESFAAVESVKAASDIYSPLTGKVNKVNTELENQPEILNQDPYGKGWICKLIDFEEEEVNNLMSSTEYKKYLEEID